MRRTIQKISLIALIIGVLAVVGCGADLDPLDDLMGANYSAILTIDFPNDATTDTLQVDTAPTICDIDADTGEITYDFYSDTYGHVEITAAADAAGITLESYTVEYFPVVDSDAVGGPFTAPTLVQPLPRYTTTYIAPGSTVEVPVILVSMSTHHEFNIKMGWVTEDGTPVSIPYNSPQEGTYSVRVTLNFANSDLELVLDRTAYFSDYSYCE